MIILNTGQPKHYTDSVSDKVTWQTLALSLKFWKIFGTHGWDARVTETNMMLKNRRKQFELPQTTVRTYLKLWVGRIKLASLLEQKLAEM